MTNQTNKMNFYQSFKNKPQKAEPLIAKFSLRAQHEQ